ncbi:hypothetical protein HOF67_00855 [Candidatus Peregrinibacteria bacterium]|jgi:hypothetical protein|nr:hypothetical protein [Candidatus Peregrinibacteria bacterium]
MNSSISNSKKSVLAIAIFLIILLALDRAISFAISEAIIARQYDTRIQKIMDQELDHDILVFGSSRASRNIRAEQISEITGTSMYNLGFHGSDVDYHEDILRLTLEAGNIPKEIILVVDDDFEVIEHPAINFRIDTLYPFLNYRPVTNIVCKRETKECIPTYISHSYTQNINLDEALAYLDEGQLIPDDLNQIQPDGSMPIFIKSEKYPAMQYDGSTRQYDPTKESPLLLEEFAKIVALCEKYNIALTILFPPNYKKPTAGFKKRILELAGPNATSIDFSTDPTFQKKSLYYDTNHLDDQGSLLFSKKLANTLKNR